MEQFVFRCCSVHVLFRACAVCIAGMHCAHCLRRPPPPKLVPARAGICLRELYKNSKEPYLRATGGLVGSIFPLTFGPGCGKMADKMEGFVHFREVLSPTAVYVLWWRGKVVYVGKSKNIYARLATHKQNLMRKRNDLTPYADKSAPFEFDDVWVRFMPVDELDREETKLILHYRPKYNIQLNHPSYDMSKVPAFRELLAKARRSPTVLRRMPWEPPRRAA